MLAVTSVTAMRLGVSRGRLFDGAMPRGKLQVERHPLRVQGSSRTKHRLPRGPHQSRAVPDILAAEVVYSSLHSSYVGSRGLHIEFVLYIY